MLTQRVQKHFLSRVRDISFQRPALLSHPTTRVPTFYLVLSGVDPDVNVTLNVEILPEFEVALRWQVSDHRESAYLYKLTVSSQRVSLLFLSTPLHGLVYSRLNSHASTATLQGYDQRILE